ncbi:8242_t:CDS:1, partial [Racocetra persica]
INVKNRINSKKISNRRYAYKRAYKKAQDILYQKIGNTYEIYYRDWLSFEDFKVGDPVLRLWKRFIKYAKAYTGNNNFSVSTE